MAWSSLHGGFGRDMGRSFEQKLGVGAVIGLGREEPLALIKPKSSLL